MPFDGVVAKCTAKELSEVLDGGRLEKIFQPEPDEIIINVRAKGKNLRLLLSASPNYPRIHVTETTRENPAVPPVFCMLLRKHLSGGRVISVEFNDYERIIGINIESVSELGDLQKKKLLIEIMGRHSNIILLNDENKIIDSIKHVDSSVSSVREIMPARPYTPPPEQNKANPELLDIDLLLNNIEAPEETTIENYLLTNIKGFSPLLCREICHRAEIDSRRPVSLLRTGELAALRTSLHAAVQAISASDFKPCIVFTDKTLETPLDFHCMEMTQYQSIRYLDSISSALDEFYREKDRSERLKQKKADLYKVLGNSLDRCKKKVALQQDKLRDVADREKLKLYGELITANIYCIPPNSPKASLLNYYSETEEYADIPLDKSLSPQENAQRYFKRYQKAKNTYVHTSKQLEESLSELEYLESVLHILDNCVTLQEIGEIRQELLEQGYISKRRKSNEKKQAKATEPLRYRSSDGLEIWVGKNNRQNDQLTMKQASSNDMWLHTRNIPGSHVIIKKAQNDIPDSTLLEAAVLAAYHSKAKQSSTVPVDYTTVRNVKKPAGAKPGMVIYENFKTLIVTPGEKLVEKLSQKQH